MAKQFDLSEYTNDTVQTQGRNNKYARFINPEDIKEVKFIPGTTKRINMAFTDRNYMIVQAEANRMGITLAGFINSIISIMLTKDVDEYIDSFTIARTKDIFARRKGNPAKRICLKFTAKNHERITEESAKHNQTITQYVNTLVEYYAQDKY